MRQNPRDISRASPGCVGTNVPNFRKEVTASFMNVRTGITLQICRPLFLVRATTSLPGVRFALPDCNEFPSPCPPNERLILPQPIADSAPNPRQSGRNTADDRERWHHTHLGSARGPVVERMDRPFRAPDGCPLAGTGGTAAGGGGGGGRRHQLRRRHPGPRQRRVDFGRSHGQPRTARPLYRHHRNPRQHGYGNRKRRPRDVDQHGQGPNGLAGLRKTVPRIMPNRCVRARDHFLQMGK
jgi:hypothetical protein